MIVCAKVSTLEQFEALMKVRQAVFVEEQQIDSALEFDENDARFKTCLEKSEDVNEIRYYIIANDSQVVGTTRARQTKPNYWKIERFAVLNSCRGQGIGKRLLNFVLSDLLPTHPERLYLNAQKTAIPFYEKCVFEGAESSPNGRFVCIGEEFSEANIPHQQMEWKESQE